MRASFRCIFSILRGIARCGRSPDRATVARSGDRPQPPRIIERIRFDAQHRTTLFCDRSEYSTQVILSTVAVWYNLNMTIGKRVKALRRSKGLTREILAFCARIGLSAFTVLVPAWPG